MTGPKDPPLQRGSGRVLMLGGLVLAVAAAVVLAVGAEDVGLLRLGILAALWAALFGTFAAVRSRREVNVGADRADQMRTIYRLELDREIAARREHELTVERELREQAERRERDELAALRGELQSLRETLRNLLGGDVLVERVALRAESTRLLQMPDHPRPVTDARGRASDGGSAGTPRSLTAAESPSPATGRDPWDVGHRPDPPQRRREPADVPSRPAAQSQPQSRPRREAAPASAAPGGAEPDIFTRTAAELAGNTGAADRSWSPAVASPAGSGSAGPDPGRVAAAWQPAVASGSPPARRRRADSRSDLPDPPVSAPPVPPAPASPPVSNGEAGLSTFQDKDPLGAVSRQGMGTGRHSRPSVPRYGGATQAMPVSNGNGAHRNGAHGNGAHGNGAHGNGAHGNGAHGNGANGTGSYGSHANRQAAGTGRRRAPEETPAEPPAGGRRVDELLAAYGEGAAPRHRRRRAED